MAALGVYLTAVAVRQLKTDLPKVSSLPRVALGIGYYLPRVFSLPRVTLGVDDNLPTTFLCRRFLLSRRRISLLCRRPR